MKSVLDQWIKEKHGISDREGIVRWQTEKVKAMFAYVCEKSPFYRKRFKDCESPRDLESFSKLPFLSDEDLRRDGLKMLCVSQGEIERVVTLQTSGTAGRPKRLYFTGEDLELTVDFFCHGMGQIVAPGEKTAVFLPSSAEDSVGKLLLKGLKRRKVIGYGPGPVEDPQASLQLLLREHIHAFVGTPLQALALAEHAKAEQVSLNLKNILVSTDYLADSVRKRIEDGLECRVFNHFGMTETGLGGALECCCRKGMHIRENDLLMEVIDPSDGKALPDGKEGELVLTTLTRKGMPLIRYRTGDRVVLDHSRCGCGSYLTRIVKTGGRIQGAVGDGKRSVDMAALDEVLFSIDGLLDYGVEYKRKEQRFLFHLVFFGETGGKIRLARQLLEEQFMKKDGVEFELTWETAESWNPQYKGKRYIRCR